MKQSKLIRIVQLTIHPDKVDDFLRLFDDVSSKIKTFDGCIHLELLQNPVYPSLIATYSHWVSHDHLDVYRKSELFKSTWAETKKLFAAPPQATSYSLIRDIQ